MKAPLLLPCIISLFAADAPGQTSGAVDTSFVIGAGAGGGAFNLVRAIDVDDQSRILLAGSFTSFNGVPAAGIVRLLPSGTTDVSFNPGIGLARAGSLATAYALLQPAQGSTLVGGLFDSFNGLPATNLVMLTDTGSLDTNFFPQVRADEVIYALARQPGKGILIGGLPAVQARR